MGFIITYLVLNNNYLLAAGLLIIRQAFDAADGYVARRYNLKSKFGEVYDVFSDLTTVIPLVLYIAYYYKEFVFDNYLAMIPLVMVILLTFLYRDKCIKKENAACKNPAIRHEVLKSTKFLSYFELVCILSLAIVNIGIKRDGL
jgi:phosphatidylglycerophosphate synthase